MEAPAVLKLGADGGYAGEKRRSRLRERGIPDFLEIRQKPNTITRVTVLSRRWVGERTCAGLAVTVGVPAPGKRWETDPGAFMGLIGWVLFAAGRFLLRRVARGLTH